MQLCKCIQPLYDAFVCQNILHKILNVQQIYQVIYINLFYESNYACYIEFTHFDSHLREIYKIHNKSQQFTGAPALILPQQRRLLVYHRCRRQPFQRSDFGQDVPTMNIWGWIFFKLHLKNWALLVAFFRGVGSSLQVSKILLATHVMITDNIHYMILHDYNF